MFAKLKPWLEPQSYTFKDPDTGRVFTADTKAQLISLIVHYRINNNFEPIEHLNSVLENYWCSLPANVGRCEHYTLRRGMMDVLRGGIALLTNMFVPERNRVDQEEAERRALICKDCQYNVFPDKHGFIKMADEIVELSLGKNTKTRQDADLGNCQVCTCVLRFKVHVKGPFKFKADELEQMKNAKPNGCWQPDAK